MLPRPGKPTSDRPLGAHVSVADGFCQALERAARIDATAIQIFTRNQLRWRSPPLDKMEVAAFRTALATSQVRYACAHAGYLINLASPSQQTRELSIAALLDELGRADALGCHCLVLHPGSPKEDGAAVGVQRVVEGLKKALDHTDELAIRIALENTAGQGNCLGASWEQLFDIARQVGHADRLGFCLDSAHAFAAGMDVSQSGTVARLAAQIEAAAGIARLYVMHLNDSKVACGKLVDRHEHIGQGCIGDGGFQAILREPLLATVPGVIETPKEEPKWFLRDAENLARLRRLQETG
jgi:deoxyribonuclease-4